MLSWQDAIIIACCLAVAAGVIRRRWGHWPGVVTEVALLFGLYGLWQFAGSFTVMSTAGAVPRGRWLWHAERLLHRPARPACSGSSYPTRC
jgi:hypothetical protein